MLSDISIKLSIASEILALQEDLRNGDDIVFYEAGGEACIFFLGKFVKIEEVWLLDFESCLDFVKGLYAVGTSVISHHEHCVLLYGL